MMGPRTILCYGHEAQHQRRERMLQEYLATVGVSIRAKVVGACRGDFEDLGMRVPG